jgi:hypothetical protein
MYTLYTDKSEDFKCNIGVEGADITNTHARLVLENSTMNILFEGKVNKNGDCVIPIKKLKHILPEGVEGKLKLEVIADDTYFSPWEDNFIVKVNKRVTVEVANDTRKNKIEENKINIQVTGINSPKQTPKKTVKVERKKTHSDIMAEILDKKGITLSNFSKHVESIKPLVEKYIKRYKVNQTPDSLLNEIIINLK